MNKEKVKIALAKRYFIQQKIKEITFFLGYGFIFWVTMVSLGPLACDILICRGEPMFIAGLTFAILISMVIILLIYLLIGLYKLLKIFIISNWNKALERAEEDLE